MTYYHHNERQIYMEASGLGKMMKNYILQLLRTPQDDCACKIETTHITFYISESLTDEK